MNILDWFRGKPTPKRAVQYLAGDGHGAFDLESVPKWTHAGKKGKKVFCPRPECSYPTHVYNFAWSALVCKACGATIDKCDWLIERVK
tara:strand:+ start:484 stop:747 length:264 start_codon:yes stop_codon:yes gene_type:complete